MREEGRKKIIKKKESNWKLQENERSWESKRKTENDKWSEEGNARSSVVEERQSEIEKVGKKDRNCDGRKDRENLIKLKKLRVRKKERNWERKRESEKEREKEREKVRKKERKWERKRESEKEREKVR